MKKVFISVLLALLLGLTGAMPCFADDVSQSANIPSAENETAANLGNAEAGGNENAGAGAESDAQSSKIASESLMPLEITPKEAGALVAIGSPTADKINNAIAASTGATTIVLNDDVTLDKQVVVPTGKIITIQGKNGQTITVKGTTELFNTSLYMMSVEVDGSLTLGSNLTIDASSTVATSLFVRSLGTLVIDGCAMTGACVNAWCNGALWSTGPRAVLTINSGTISDCDASDTLTGTVLISDKATATLAGGTIENNLVTSQSAATVYVRDATLTMSGGEVKNNSIVNIGSNGYYSCPGVLVYAFTSDATEDTAQTSSFHMTGGTISGNKGYRGGGVLVCGGDYGWGDLYSKAYFTMDGGSISGNSGGGFATQYAPYYLGGGGGGVFVEYGGEFTMNDGEISDNSVIGEGGGVATFDGFVGSPDRKVPYSTYSGIIQHGRDLGDWPEFYPAKFTMNGGTISGNEAKADPNGSNGCGGGVYLASADNVISGGVIEDNTAEKQGGGCYVAAVPYGLHIYNSIITDNAADIIGGGIWICPTGNVKAFIYDGTACYGNTANGAANEVAVVKQAAFTHSIVLDDRMLGGGLAHWYQDGGIDDSILGNADSSVPRYDPSGTSNIEVSVPRYSDGGFSLTSAPDAAAIQLANAKAKVYIQNNKAPRGAGIGSNGDVYTGRETPGPVEATVTKVWDTDSSADKTIPEKVTVWLCIDGVRTESVELNAANSWAHTFTGLPANAVVTFEEEELAGFSTIYGVVSQDAATGNWSGVITNKKDVPPVPTPEPEDPVPSTIPRTGDNDNLYLCVLLTILGLAGMYGACALRRKGEAR